MDIEKNESQTSEQAPQVNTEEILSTLRLGAESEKFGWGSADQIAKLDPELQAALAKEFFDSQIGDGEMPIKGSLRGAYAVYQKLQGSAFGITFKELESNRLQKYGFAPLGAL